MSHGVRRADRPLLATEHTTNCRNCGAPLKGDCEYCGTRYVSVDRTDPLRDTRTATSIAVNRDLEAMRMAYFDSFINGVAGKII